MKTTINTVLLAWISIVLMGSTTGCGKHRGPGTIEGAQRPASVVRQMERTQASAAKTVASSASLKAPTKQILFGDLHVHTTYSADAFLMSLPIQQGDGAHPVSDACDYARYCSALDFWSINDHAEALTPRRWQETKDTIRRCNEIAGDSSDPDMVSFLGWEWTQIGQTREDHYGHKNVILLETDEGSVPKRPIHSGGNTRTAMREQPPLWQRFGLPIFDSGNYQYYLDLNYYQAELAKIVDCPKGIDTRELPEHCAEGAETPAELFEKLSQWGFETMVIPHGNAWGIYTPSGSNWRKQLSPAQHDPKLQHIIEVFSGHGNSEEYRDWRSVDFAEDGSRSCPEPTTEYEPCCWRAGEIIRQRCGDATEEECARRVADAKQNYVDADVTARTSIIAGTEMADWMNCGNCTDCYAPAFNYKPASSVQAAMAISDFSTADPGRFRFGFISSSDNHTARPGTGYKESGRLPNTEARGPRSEEWSRRASNPVNFADPAPESTTFDLTTDPRPAWQYMDFERAGSFFITGGLVAVHSEDRSRNAIWDAMEHHETYGTSGPRILLWFDLLNGPKGVESMGSVVQTRESPRFRVRAVGSFEQKPGCPDFSNAALSQERLEQLCQSECYNPGNKRRHITRIEVVRVRPQERPGEDMDNLIQDPWKVIECPAGTEGCVVEFEDPDYLSGGREASYYVRAIEEPSLAINTDGIRCTYDDRGNCTAVDPCYGDYRTPIDDDCLAMNEERAWSSPIYLRP
ncbi:MAG: DUF3604 domain-containing protein [Deltaproteobacteria bacterium]